MGNYSTVGELVDNVFSHNEIVGLWHKEYDEIENRFVKVLKWRGEAWSMPLEWSNKRFSRIFGTCTDDPWRSGDINILYE